MKSQTEGYSLREPLRPDHRIIVDLVESGSRVLDLGCGDGDLIYRLAHEKGANVQGVELDEQSIYKCVEKGLSVFHSDIDSGLAGFPDHSFDYVILNESLQEVKKVDFLLQEALRVGSKVIVGFPNFANWRARWMLFARGRAPTTPSLPYEWHNTPNLRFLSLYDFEDYCRERKIPVLRKFYLGNDGQVDVLPNLRALTGLFVLTSENKR